jgi:pyruvate/2-oxoglutarate dehydrogenase complex dihydrolipoamide acyltransferase (E2) component
MRHEIKVPDLGEGVTEAFVSEWLVPLDANVSVGTEVIEMMTDKANFAVEAEAAGTLVEQRVAEEERVTVGQVLGVIETADDAPA